MVLPGPRHQTPWWGLLVALSLSAAVLLVHRPTLSAYLFEDDLGWILYGRTSTVVKVFDPRGRNTFHRPVIGLHFLVFAGWLGGSARLLHLANLALHAMNCGLVFVLGRRLGLLAPGAFTSALIMAVLTRNVESVAWISGVSAVLLTSFFLLAHIFQLRASTSGRGIDRVVALGSFAAALLTHEASVVLLPMLVLLDWTCRPAQPGPARVRDLGVRFLPHLGMTFVFLLLTYIANRSNFVVTEGHYALGWHAWDTLSRYLVSLYVGRTDMGSRLMTVALVLAGLLWGRAGLRFALAWMLLTLLPYCFFTWGLTGRYLYLPGVGFALALGTLVPNVAARAAPMWLRLVTGAAVAFIAWRFAFFGYKTARDYRARTLPYEAYVQRSRDQHRSLAPGALIEVPAPRADEPAARFLEDLLRVAYDDPTLRVVVEGPSPP